MNYISSFNGLNGLESPCAVFFDPVLDNLPNIDPTFDLDLVRFARSSTGYGGQLNPVRGQLGAKYFATFLKQTHTGTNPYSNCTILDQLLTSGPVGAYTSGNASYNMFPSYMTSGHARQIVLNPFDETYMFRTENTFYGSLKYSFTETFFIFNGYELEKATYSYPGGIEGYDNPMYVKLVAGCLYTDVPVSFSSIIQAGPSKIGEGRVYYEGNIVPENETVNLTEGLVVLSSNVHILRSGLDYCIESDLLPGARPSISFPTITHTEL